MGGKIIPRIRVTSAKDLVEVEAELGKNHLSGLVLIQRERATVVADFLYI